jgi:hypothetical protein
LNEMRSLWAFTAETQRHREINKTVLLVHFIGQFTIVRVFGGVCRVYRLDNIIGRRFSVKCVEVFGDAGVYAAGTLGGDAFGFETHSFLATLETQYGIPSS